MTSSLELRYASTTSPMHARGPLIIEGLSSSLVSLPASSRASVCLPVVYLAVCIDSLRPLATQ